MDNDDNDHLLQVIAAEGEHKASRALRHAAEVIAECPAALQVIVKQDGNDHVEEYDDYDDGDHPALVIVECPAALQVKTRNHFTIFIITSMFQPPASVPPNVD